MQKNYNKLVKNQSRFQNRKPVEKCKHIECLNTSNKINYNGYHHSLANKLESNDNLNFKAFYKELKKANTLMAVLSMAWLMSSPVQAKTLSKNISLTDKLEKYKDMIEQCKGMTNESMRKSIYSANNSGVSFNDLTDQLINIQLPKSQGDTLMHIAIRNGSPENNYIIVTLLRKHGSLNIRNYNNETALDVAKTLGFTSTILHFQKQLLKNQTIVSLSTSSTHPSLPSHSFFSLSSSHLKNSTLMPSSSTSPLFFIEPEYRSTFSPATIGGVVAGGLISISASIAIMVYFCRKRKALPQHRDKQENSNSYRRNGASLYSQDFGLVAPLISSCSTNAPSTSFTTTFKSIPIQKDDEDKKTQYAEITFSQENNSGSSHFQRNKPLQSKKERIYANTSILHKERKIDSLSSDGHYKKPVNCAVPKKTVTFKLT